MVPNVVRVYKIVRVGGLGETMEKFFRGFLLSEQRFNYGFEPRPRYEEKVIFN